MTRWILKPTTADEVVARSIRQHTTRRVEHFNRELTFLADERIFLFLTGGVWLTAHWGNDKQRQQANHLAFSVLTTCVLPHLLKRVVAQQRPDRRVVPGWRHGIPRSGKAYDAFPSGHAMHVGAIVSAIPGCIQNGRQWLGARGWPLRPHGLSCSRTGCRTLWQGSPWAASSSGF